jgi:hypothetical protein
MDHLGPSFRRQPGFPGLRQNAEEVTHEDYKTLKDFPPKGGS